MTPAISARRLSALIGGIYDCALEPVRWPQTLDELRLELGFANAGLSVMALPAGKFLLNATAGMEKKWADAMPDYGAEFVRLFGGTEKIVSWPLNEPLVLSLVRDEAVWKNLRYFKEWVEPQGLIDNLAIGLACDRAMVGSLAMGRHRSVGPIAAREIHAARLLAPHLQRAVAVSKLLDVQSMAAATFSAALDTLSAAVVLVGPDLHIVHANRAAQAMLAAGDPLRDRNGRLALSAPAPAAALKAAVAQAAENESRLGRRGFGIPVMRADGEPCVLHVLPMQYGALRPGLAPSAVAAIFVAPAVSPPPAPAEAIAALFDLTPAEARVLSLIAEGLPPAQIAQILDVGQSTVRTHLLRLYSKTGTTRQTELANLAASLSMPA